jgi:hypothetical protein
MGLCAACIHISISGIQSDETDMSRAIHDCTGGQLTPRILLRRAGTPAME